jgi:glycopeptide antibiotics resistance protein
MLKHYLRQHSRSIYATFWIVGGIFFIVMLTLYPFRFESIVWGKKNAIKEFFRNPSDWFDFYANILLFMPFGYGLSQSFGTKQFSNNLKLLFILGLSLAFTIMIETLQLFLPIRSSSVIDIFTNTLGGTVGGAYGLLSGHQLTRRGRDWVTKQWLKPRSVAIVLALWLVLMFGVTGRLTSMVYLDKWNPDYNLVIGNDVMGDNGWRGNVKGVSFVDRALSKSEAQQFLQSSQFPRLDASLADYDLTGSPPYRDRSRLALPRLEPQSIDNPTTSPSPNLAWYSTQQPPIALTEAIRKSSAFTLATTFETQDLENLGRGLILSLSLDENQRNISLEQHKREVIARIRTSATGGNGSAIEVKTKDLELNRTHHVLLTYQDAVLTLYLDNREPSQITLRPELVFFRFLIPSIRGRGIPVNPLALNFYPIVFYAIWFLPLGTLLGRITLLLKPHPRTPSLNPLNLSNTLIIGLTIGISSLSMSWVLKSFSSQPIKIGLTCLGLSLLPIGIQLVHPIFKVRQIR